jgi:hypothetical protein
MQPYAGAYLLLNAHPDDLNHINRLPPTRKHLKFMDLSQNTVLVNVWNKFCQ